MRAIVLNLLGKLIRTLIKIKNKMTMSEVKTENQIYVWTKTEKAGTIVQLAEKQESKEWIYFTDGTRVGSKVLNEVLIPAKDEEDAKEISKTFGGIGGEVEKTSTEKKSQKTERRITDGKSAPDPEINVMMEMLKKMSTKNQAEMPVLVNIPSNQVYEMLKEQMDLEDSDLNEQIGLLIENQINNLQDQLRSQIQSFITNYYTK